MAKFTGNVCVLNRDFRIVVCSPDYYFVGLHRYLDTYVFDGKVSI